METQPIAVKPTIDPLMRNLLIAQLRTVKTQIEAIEGMIAISSNYTVQDPDQKSFRDVRDNPYVPDKIDTDLGDIFETLKQQGKAQVSD